MKGMTIAVLEREPKDLGDALEQIGLSRLNISFAERAIVVGTNGEFRIMIQWSVRPANLIPYHE